MKVFLNKQKPNELFGKCNNIFQKANYFRSTIIIILSHLTFRFYKKQKLIKLKKDLAYAKSFYVKTGQ